MDRPGNYDNGRAAPMPEAIEYDGMETGADIGAGRSGAQRSRASSDAKKSMYCEVCGFVKVSRASRNEYAVNGISMCHRCNRRIALLREGKLDAVNFYGDPKNTKYATHKAKRFIRSAIDDAVKAQAQQEYEDAARAALAARQAAAPALQAPPAQPAPQPQQAPAGRRGRKAARQAQQMTVPQQPMAQQAPRQQMPAPQQQVPQQMPRQQMPAPQQQVPQQAPRQIPTHRAQAPRMELPEIPDIPLPEPEFPQVPEMPVPRAQAPRHEARSARHAARPAPRREASAPAHMKTDTAPAAPPAAAPRHEAPASQPAIPTAPAASGHVPRHAAPDPKPAAPRISVAALALGLDLTEPDIPLPEEAPNAVPPPMPRHEAPSARTPAPSPAPAPAPAPGLAPAPEPKPVPTPEPKPAPAPEARPAPAMPRYETLSRAAAPAGGTAPAEPTPRHEAPSNMPAPAPNLAAAAAPPRHEAPVKTIGGSRRADMSHRRSGTRQKGNAPRLSGLTEAAHEAPSAPKKAMRRLAPENIEGNSNRPAFALNRVCESCGADEWVGIDGAYSYSEVCNKCEKCEVRYIKQEYEDSFECPDCGCLIGSKEENRYKFGIRCTYCGKLTIFFEKLDELFMDEQTTAALTNFAKSLLTEKVNCPQCGYGEITTGTEGLRLFGNRQTVNRCARCGFAWKPQWVDTGTPPDIEE